MKNYLTDIKSYNVWLNGEGNLPPQTGDTPLEVVVNASAIYAQKIKNSMDVAPTTSTRRVIGLRGFLNFLTEKDYIAAEIIPQEGLKTKKILGGVQANVKWLKSEDVAKIYEAIESQPRVSEITRLRNKTIITILVNTGVRVGELCDMRIGDINLEKGVLSVKDCKGGKYRDVPIDCKFKQDKIHIKSS